MTTKMVSLDPTRKLHTIHTGSGRKYTPGSDGVFEVDDADVAEMDKHGLIPAAAAAAATDTQAMATRIVALERRVAVLEKGAKAA
jgi:hypothetical protein